MTKPAADARQRIIQAAYELFYRSGFARVSIDLIAEKAGFTKRTLYHHFKSKDHLLTEVISIPSRPRHGSHPWLG